MEGYKYTWIRRKGKPGEIEEKLNRVIVTCDWLDLFLDFQLSNLVNSKLDHFHILLKLGSNQRRPLCKKLCFENSWLFECDLNSIINEEWMLFENNDLISKLDICCLKMDSWGCQIINAYKSQIDNCRKQLEVFHKASNEKSINRFSSISETINNLIAREELY